MPLTTRCYRKNVAPYKPKYPSYAACCNMSALCLKVASVPKNSVTFVMLLSLCLQGLICFHFSAKKVVSSMN